MPTALNVQNDFVNARALRVLVEAAHRIGIDVNADAVAPTRHATDDMALVPSREYRAVLTKIFMDPRDTLGIELAEAMPIEAMGLWGFLLRTSPTFGAMLRRAQHYIRVFFRYTRIAVTVENSRAVLTCIHPDPSPFGRREQEVCFFLGQWLALGRTLIGAEVAAMEAHMRWPGPTDAAPLEAHFGCPVMFRRSEDALVFRRKILDLPLPEHTPELAKLFQEYAGAVITRVGGEVTFIERVRESIIEGSLSGTCDETAVARHMCITPRTLRRRLAESGRSFRELRLEVLRTRAETMLQDNRLPLTEISVLLGYAEPSSFHRAFRRWTGLTPQQWRKRHGTTPQTTSCAPDVNTAP
jgi:AraC-like DNA-binding protein